MKAIMPTHEEFTKALDKAQEYARAAGMKQEEIDEAIRIVRDNKRGENAKDKE